MKLYVALVLPHFSLLHRSMVISCVGSCKSAVAEAGEGGREAGEGGRG